MKFRSLSFSDQFAVAAVLLNYEADVVDTTVFTIYAAILGQRFCGLNHIGLPRLKREGK
jgi:hypothetical protein